MATTIGFRGFSVGGNVDNISGGYLEFIIIPEILNSDNELNLRALGFLIDNRLLFEVDADNKMSVKIKEYGEGKDDFKP